MDCCNYYPKVRTEGYRAIKHLVTLEKKRTEKKRHSCEHYCKLPAENFVDSSFCAVGDFLVSCTGIMMNTA